MEKHFKIQFSLVILMMFLLGAISIYFVENLYVTTKNMYEHPYTVSNKLKEIKISIHQMHLSTLSIDELDIREIGLKDAGNRKNLSIIASQYLGDQQDVTRVHNLYEKWLSKRVYGSDLTVEEQVLFDQLLKAIEFLSAFADNKAISLYEQAKKETQYYPTYIGIFLLVAAIVSILLLMRTLKELRTITIHRKQYLNLIDQNVMIAAIEDDGRIFDISNRLSRFLSKKKSDVTGNQLKDIFFDTDDSQFEEMWRQVHSGATWHGDIKVVSNNIPQWLGIDVLPMKNTDSSYSGFRLLASDITSRKSLEKISITDTLTGLLNRRSFDETMDRQTKLAARNSLPLTIGILDVDYFKLYNDTYGHISGDKVLTNIATILSKMLSRPDDFVFRIGGEEFCFMFNSNNEDESRAYIEQIREKIQNLKIVHEQSKVHKYVTISIGASFFDGAHVVDGKALMSEADDNLYRAKEMRNHTVQSVHGQL
ncbi:MAG: diguanylate cyclase [Methylophagaceae bacterium]